MEFMMNPVQWEAPMERRAEPGGVAGMDDRCACGRSLPGIRDACGSAVPLDAQPRSGAEGAR